MDFRLQGQSIARRRNEKGQISIFFAFGLIAAVSLLALILNTGALTIRKGEMQNAADAGARAGAVNLGRAMNLIASNNTGMTEMVSTMIVVRAVLQTSEAMTVILPGMITLAKLSLNAPLAAALAYDLQVYQMMIPELTAIDRSVERGGWQTLSALDKLNQTIKSSTPALSVSQAVEFAKSNGADQAPHSLLIPGLPNRPVIILPLGRGAQRHLVTEADCQLSNLKRYGFGMIMVSAPASAIVAAGVFEANVNCNMRRLSSSSSICAPGARTPPLVWPNDPPRPMLLTDKPSDDPKALVSSSESEVDLMTVHQYLRLLNISLGNLPRTGVLGNRKFLNPASKWIVYAEADVYNPTRWSMFSQDWRAQLVRATLLNEKIEMVGRLLGWSIPSGLGADLTLINLH